MAYFSNGSEGEILDNQCCECLHGKDDMVLCPIYLVQQHFNYDQLKKNLAPLRKAMNMLVNEQGICQMKLVLDKLYHEEDVEMSQLEKFDRDKERS